MTAPCCCRSTTETKDSRWFGVGAEIGGDSGVWSSFLPMCIAYFQPFQDGTVTSKLSSFPGTGQTRTSRITTGGVLTSTDTALGLTKFLHQVEWLTLLLLDDGCGTSGLLDDRGAGLLDHGSAGLLHH